MTGIPQRIELDQLVLGEARIKVLKTFDGNYGLHGQTGWDDLPYWEIHDAWIITTEAHGELRWGPWKYRETSKKEHRGVGELQIIEPRIFSSETKAEEYALTKALELEAKNFKVDIEFGQVGRTIFNRRVEWIKDQPPRFLGKYNPPIEKLEAKIN